MEVQQAGLLPFTLVFLVSRFFDLFFYLFVRFYQLLLLKDILVFDVSSLDLVVCTDYGELFVQVLVQILLDSALSDLFRAFVVVVDRLFGF